MQHQSCKTLHNLQQQCTTSEQGDFATTALIKSISIQPNLTTNNALLHNSESVKEATVGGGEDSFEKSDMFQVPLSTRTSKIIRQLEAQNRRLNIENFVKANTFFLSFGLLLISGDCLFQFFQSSLASEKPLIIGIFCGLIILLIGFGIFFIILSFKSQNMLLDLLQKKRNYILVIQMLCSSLYFEIIIAVNKIIDNNNFYNSFFLLRTLNLIFLATQFSSIPSSPKAKFCALFSITTHINIRLLIESDNLSISYIQIIIVTFFECVFIYNFINLQMQQKNSSSIKIEGNLNSSTTANYGFSKNERFTIEVPSSTNRHLNNIFPQTINQSPQMGNKNTQKIENTLNYASFPLQGLSHISHNSLNVSDEKNSLEGGYSSKRHSFHFRQNVQIDHRFNLKSQLHQDQQQQLQKYQMSNITELPQEFEMSKQTGKNSIGTQNIIQEGNNNQINPHINNFSDQKTLMDQLIEVDGVVVFENETQTVIFTNQNILSLLDTDQAHILKEIQQLKHFTQLQEDKFQVPDSFSSNILKTFQKDPISGLINSSIGIVNTSRPQKQGSNPQLNQVTEEDENELPMNFFQSSKIHREKSREQSFNIASSSAGKKQVGIINKSIISSSNKKKDKQLYQKSFSQLPLIKGKQTTNDIEALMEEEDSNPLRLVTRKTESIFKTIPGIPFQQNNFSYSNSESFNPMQESNQKKVSESLECQFPSILSAIGNQISKNYNNNNNINPNNNGNTESNTNITIERERTSTLKGIIDEIRSKSSTLFAQKVVVPPRKKTLKSKRFVHLNYSQHPETVIENILLQKEENSRLFLAKYSIIEHAGKILHIISIRDISNDVFEQILERQSELLIEELYRHLNFTGISQVISKASYHLKQVKPMMKKDIYKSQIRPIKVNLKLFSCLLGDVFDARQFQIKEFKLNKDFFDLKEELNQAKKQAEFLRNDLLFSFYFDQQIPIQICNDRQRIGQILTNVLVNTCKMTSKIFLKAKVCKSNESLIKVVIQNREITNQHKEEILKAFASQKNNALGYHLFISNLLAKQVSNNKKPLQVISMNPNFIKFKFYIFQFQCVSNLHGINQNNNSPRSQGSNNQQIVSSIQFLEQKYLTSLTQLDEIKSDDIDSKHKINSPLRQKLAQIGDSCKMISSNKKTTNNSGNGNMKNSHKKINNLNNKIKKQSTFEIYSNREKDQDKQLNESSNHNHNNNNNPLSIQNSFDSIERSQLSEQLHYEKNQDILEMQAHIPTKFMGYLP